MGVVTVGSRKGQWKCADGSYMSFEAAKKVGLVKDFTNKTQIIRDSIWSGSRDFSQASLLKDVTIADKMKEMIKRGHRYMAANGKA
jgi:hypothetical protein